MSDALRLSRQYLSEHPAEAAQVLETLRPEDAAEYLAELAPEEAAPLMEQLLPQYLAQCFRHWPPKTAMERLDLLSPFRACHVLRTFGMEDRHALLNLLPKKKRNALKHQITFRTDTVGAWMVEAAPIFSEKAVVQEALDHVRESGPYEGHHFFVIKRDGTFLGAVEIHRLLHEPPGRPVIQLLDPRIEPVLVQAPLTTARTLAAWQYTNALPVINTHNQVEGLLKAEHLQAALESGHAETREGSMFESLVSIYLLAATAWVRGMVSLPFLEPPATPSSKEDGHDR